MWKARWPGQYVSASEVVREALRLLKHERNLEDEELRLLREEVQLGINAADRGFFPNGRSMNLRGCLAPGARMKVRLTDPADKDILRALTDTIRLFGPQQAERYREIIRAGIRILSDDPMRSTSKACDQIANDVRSFHLQLAVGPRGGANHVTSTIV